MHVNNKRGSGKAAAPAAVFGGRVPPRKAVKAAAVSRMESGRDSKSQIDTRS